jgi:hypothetical protein
MGNQRVIAYCFELEEARTEQKPRRLLRTLRAQRLTTMNRKENLAFQRHLAAHHYPEGPFRILSRSVEKQIDCTACANCCRQTQVGLSDLDIVMIARYLGTEPAEVIRRYRTNGYRSCP